MRELLNREKTWGTHKAAEMSRVGGSDQIASLSTSSVDGTFSVNDKDLDQDWLIMLIGTLGANPGTPGSDNNVATIGGYIVGKLLYTAAKVIYNAGVRARAAGGLPLLGSPQPAKGDLVDISNPLPFQDPGERLAVAYHAAGYAFSEIFTEDWMKVNCPGI